MIASPTSTASPELTDCTARTRPSTTAPNRRTASQSDKKKITPNAVTHAQPSANRSPARGAQLNNASRATMANASGIASAAGAVQPRAQLSPTAPSASTVAIAGATEPRPHENENQPAT